MAKVRHVDFYPDEWLSGAGGLTNAERGLYITACALIYSGGGPITRADLRSMCQDHGHAFNHQFETLLRKGKLIENDGQIVNKRSLNELQKAGERLLNARQNGAKGGRPHSDNNSLAKPAGFFSEKLTTNHQLSEEEKDTLSGVQKERPVKRRMQVPEDWWPNTHGVALAEERAGWAGRKLGEEVEHFRDHHRAHGNLFASIDAAWRTWIANGVKFAQSRRLNAKPSAIDNLIEGFGRAAGLGGPPDSGPNWSSAGPLLDGQHAGYHA